MTPQPAEGIQEGMRALERAEWSAARAVFERALGQAESPAAEPLDGLGLALWFEGLPEEAIARREQAFAAYQHEGRVQEAARMGVWVAHQHMIAGRPSAARGWLARAERAVDGAAPGVGHGWVAVERARQTPAVADRVACATRAVAIAREHGADDLEVLSLSLLGRAEVGAGRVDQGLLLLEEAMAAAMAGRVRNVHTLGEAYCSLVIACVDAGEWDRAAEWCERVDAFARSHRAAPLFAACRTVHADVLVATGHWPEAEEALETALATHRRFVPGMAATTVATLAELRVQQGRLTDAVALLTGREEHPASLRALALLRIAEGRVAEAAALLERGLRATEGDTVRAVQLLAALVDARLAAEDTDAAGTAVRELARIADRTGMRIARARADLARSRLLLASGRPDDAAEPARRALAEFSALAMPLGAGEARLELARAVAGSMPELAVDEARAARDVFRSLGAARALDAASAFLRGLGSGTAGRSRVGGELTSREHEVLDLIALGMSNAGIARALTISERTASHHVSRILAKLGVRNRAEAAAYAARTGR